MLEIKEISKVYKTANLKQVALNSVSINFRKNEFVAILGPSGSGKTTLLNIIGGLDSYDSGDLIINNISTKNYSDRDFDSYRNHTIGFVFQSYNLIMHQTLLANVELALTISGINAKERKERALQALNEVGLKEHAYKKPNQLSGGQMQRVAIARALVNNPDILLADEPTGALDSETSIQVMNLLKEVANEKLVIMVTHNPELAYEYANRIITIKDGEIIDDTNPYEVTNDKEITQDNMGKSSMSFLTALSLSFSNLKTKKARTILTAFAGSIGIIGIALILSLSTGVSDYIKSIEEDTLSEYPLVIQNSAFNMSAMFEESVKKDKGEDEIGITNMITSMFSKIGSNDLKSLKENIENNEELLKNTKAIEYEYNIEPIIYNGDINNIHKVNPDETFASIGLGATSQSNNMMSSMASTNIFYKLPKNDELYKSQYDLKAGKWPTNYKECVLVLTANNNISDFLLYALDLRDYSELEKMVNDFANNIETDEITFNDTYQYEDILNKKFKLVINTDLYEYDKTYDIYIDKSKDLKYLEELLNKSEELEIVGIVKAKEDASASMLKSGIYYSDDLIAHIANEVNKSDILNKQLQNKDIDVFTGNKFNEVSNSEIDLTSLFTINSEIIKDSFSIDTQILKEAIEKIDFAKFDLDLNDIFDYDVYDITRGLDYKLIASESNILVSTITQDLLNYLKENVQIPPIPDIEPLDEETEPQPQYPDYNEYLKEVARVINEAIENYFVSDRAERLITGAIDDFLNESNIERIITRNIKRILNNIEVDLEKQVTSQLEMLITDTTTKLAEAFPNALKIDSDKLKSAFRINIDEEKLTEILTSRIISESASYENNLKKLAYIDFETPSSISIYPLDFKSKENITDYLNEYNQKMEETNPDKVINYIDYVGTLMSSVTDIINIISYVLIAFVAISLIVSSIMIGVITYISVLERKKEIGILRAIGASKRNISSVFNAETFIIGLLSGLIGVGLTLILLVPANSIIHSIANNNSINAKLPIIASIILIILSTVLTLIGGLIPSKKAANSNPVEALRE